MILFLRKLPEFHYRHAVWMALGIALTNGIRIGGLLLIPYLFMFAGLYLLIHKWPWKFFSAGWWRFALKGLGVLVAISLSGYFLSLLTWPYALQDVINHPIKSFQVMSNIQVSIRVLYDGMVQWSDRLPWHYIPRNVLLTVPVLILLAWWLSFLTWFRDRREGNGYWYFVLWFTALFPVLFIIFRESNVYGGWRHMMFIYPSILALAAISLSSLMAKARKTWTRAAILVVILAGVVHPLRHVILNHPNTYIYFNEWAGGINRTYGTMETDYYANSLKPASDLFLEEVLPSWKESREYPVKVVSNFNMGYYFRNHREDVQSFYSRYYDRGKSDWDYAILYCNYIHPFQLKNGLWPPKNTIHEIKVDSVVVAAIVERKDRSDHFGASLMNEGMEEQDGRKLEQALEYLEKAVEYDPNNEAALLDLGNNYIAFLLFDKARQTMEELLKIYPDYDKALNLKGYSYLVESEYKQDISLVDDAIGYINMAIRSNYKFYSGYYNLGLCYGLKNDFGNAEYNLQQAIKYNRRFIPAYEKLAEIYEFSGDTETAALVRDQMRRVQ
jgi:tetratricopeptide (TPR) repeat protein